MLKPGDKVLSQFFLTVGNTQEWWVTKTFMIRYVYDDLGMSYKTTPTSVVGCDTPSWYVLYTNIDPYA